MAKSDDILKKYGITQVRGSEGNTSTSVQTTKKPPTTGGKTSKADGILSKYGITQVRGSEGNQKATENRQTGSAQNWVDSSVAHLKNAEDYLKSWRGKNDTGYAALRKENSSLLAEAYNLHNQYSDDKEAAEYIEEVISALQNAGSSFKKYSDYYGRWETEDDYNKYLAQQKVDAQHAAYDLAAGEKEIADLEAQLAQMEQDNRYNDLMQRVNPSKPTTPTRQDISGNPHTMWQQGAVETSGITEEEKLRQLIAQKKQEYTLSKRYQESAAFDSATQNADFEANSIALENADDLYNWINDEQFRADYEAPYQSAPNPGARKSKFARKGYNYMNEDEVKLFNYYYATEGKKKALEYLDNIQERLNIRAGSEVAQGLQGRTGTEIAYGGAVGLNQFASGMGGAWDLVFGNDEYTPISRQQAAGQAIREDLADDGLQLPKMFGGGSLAQAGYDLVSTTANMAPSILASVIAAPVGSTLMGVSAAGNAYQQAINEGYDVDAARAYGTAIGVAETAMQSIMGGISALGGISPAVEKAISGIDNGILRFMAKYGASIASEGLEEGLQEILDPILRNAYFYEDANVDWAQVVYSALLGGLSAGVIEGVGGVAANAITNVETKQNYGIAQQELVTEALEIDPDNSFAQRMQNRLDKGKDLSGKQLNKLVQQNEQAIAQMPAAEEAEVTEEPTAQTAANPERLKPQQYRELLRAAQLAQNGTGTVADEVAATQENTATMAQTEPVSATVRENRTVAKNATVPANDQQITGKLTAEESTEVPEKEVTLEEASQKYGAQAGAMMRTYNEGQDVEKFDNAYRTAYDMGRIGMSASYLAKNETVSYLTEDQRQLAYDAGVKAAATKAAAKDAENKAAANGLTGYKKGGVVRGEGVKIADLKKAFKDPRGKAYKSLSTIAKATGINIVLYKSQTDASGKFTDAYGKFNPNDPGTIWIDINAGWDSEIADPGVEDFERYILLRTFTHEFSHFIEKWNPIKYNEFRRAAFDTMTARGVDVNERIELRMEKDGLDYEAASREVLADALVDILPDSSFVQQLAEKHQTVFQKLLQKMKEFAQNLRDYFDSLGSEIDPAAEGLKEQSKYLDSIVKMWDEIAVQAVENFQKTVATEEVVVSKKESTTAVSETKVETKTQEVETKSEETTEVTSEAAEEETQAETEEIEETSFQKDAYTDLESRLQKYTHVDINGIRYSAKAKKEGGYFGNIKRLPMKAGGVPIENARGTIYSSYTPGFATREEAISDLVAVARNNKLLGAVQTAENTKEVNDNGKESETGTDARAVHEPVRGSEGPARLLEGVEPEAVRGSSEGRQPVQSGSDQGAGDAGRDRRADAAGDVSERGTGDRVGGDLQQLPAVSEETDKLTSYEAAKEYAKSKGYKIELNKLAAKKNSIQVDISDKQGLPTFNPIIIGELGKDSDPTAWNKVKKAIDRREAAEATKLATDNNVGTKSDEDTNVPTKEEKAEQLHEEVVQEIERKSTVNPKGSNFVIGESLNLPSGAKARIRANIEAIKLVKQIAAENRIATPAEQEILSKYVGWGGLPDAFGKPTTNYTTRRLEYEAVKGLEAEFEELKTVLTEQEYKSARESTKNAHYTSIEVIKAMYDGLKQLGFTGGRMLEPSSGVGNFVGAMPADMTAQVKSWTMVELDNITGLFAKHLYPNADVRIQGFEQANIPDGYMDVAIGNVPFGNYGITDKHYPKTVTGSIHNYFFAKSLDKVRTGGIVMFITSSYTMNGRDNAVRKYIMQKADLLGAIRLPNTAFAGNAGTSVVTDILILKKRADKTTYAGEAFQDSNWENLSLGGYSGGAYINEYFAKHPEMVLGIPKIARGMYSATDITYDPFTDRGTLGDQIREAMKNIQGKMDYPAQLSAEKANIRQATAKKKNQKLQIKDGVIHSRDENGNLTKVDVDKDTAARITGMVAIRDAYVQLCDAMQQGVRKQDITKLRKALNKAYDSFVEKYGYLNAPKNKKAINAFADRYAILSLENYSTEGKKVTATKSDVFTKDTIAANRTADSADNVEEGLTISLNTVGMVDVGVIARLTGQNAESVTRQLIDQRLVFKDKDGNLIPAAQYLSGNVRAKLREMEGLTGIDKDYQNNVEALREVVPPTVQHTDIYVNPGANWVPAQVYEDFVGYILKRNNYTSYRTGKKDFSVEYVAETNEYKVTINEAYAKQSAQNTQVWGESGKSFSTIFENMLNGRRTNVYRDRGDGTRELDRVKTEAVAEKAEKLNEEFRKWLWEDEERRAEMQDLYNETYNALVTPKYSGESLTVNGLNSTYTLRPHQKDAVARIINSGGNTLLAHRVGAGKTMEMATAAMKLKQLGVIKKPMFVVPNNVVAQWGKEFKDYFPAANILVVGDEDMTAAERMTTINKIKNNDYDAVILAYTKFEKIQMTTEWRQKFYEEQIDSILFAINAEKESQGGKGFTVKQLEQKRKQLEGKLKKLTEKAKDEDGAMFEDLGVDSLFVDEAHNFKNLEYSTRMTNVSGLGKADGAQRSFDLYTKVRYLQQLNGGRGVVFATATPVMNSMTEMYIMQKYLQPDMLKQLGIEHFDSWAKMFGEVVNALEIAPSGSGYRLKQTFSKFKNVKALQQMFRSFTDVLTDIPGLKIPKMKGKKVQIVECEQGEFQKNYMADLAKRAENVKNVDPSEDNMLKITSDGRKISYSQRMIDPSLPYEEAGKIYKCCENVFKVYQESSKTKGTQMIFCDMATPKGKSSTKAETDTNTDEFAAVDVESAQLYDDMKARLVQLGIPAKEIAFIHDAKNDKQKAELAEKMNNGTIRVLIGSTGKMGVGLNAQKKAVAIHHLDAPWRPGDIEQRDGRVFRQKNENDEAYKFVYVTRGSFDSRLWDILERKQKFINQVMNGEDVGNEIEDTGEVTLSAAEVKAVASDNPLIMEQVALEKEISKLQSLQQAHRANVSRAQEMIVKDRRNIALLENLIANGQADIRSRKDTYSSDKVFSIRIGNQTYTDKKDAGLALVSAAQAKAKEGEYTDIGQFAGFTLRVVKTAEGIKGMVSGANSYDFKTYPLNPSYGIGHLISVVEGIDERMKVWNRNLTESKEDLKVQNQIVSEPFAEAEKLKQKRSRYNEVMDILNPPKEEQKLDTDGGDAVQYQQRHKVLTNREVLEMAIDELELSDLTPGERGALDILKGRLDGLKDLQSQREKQGQLYREQQFGTKVDRTQAEKTLNRMKVLDGQIEKAKAEILSIEDKQVLRSVLQKARKVVEKQQWTKDQETLKRWRDRRNNADAIKKYRTRLKKDVDELTGWVLHPNNNDVVKHIPEVLKSSVIPFLSSVDFTSKRQLQGGDATKADQQFMKRLEALKAALDQKQNTEALYSDYTDLPPDFMEKLNTLTEAAKAIVNKNSGEFVVNQMTSAELKALSEVVRNLKAFIQNFNRFHYNAMFRHVFEAGDNSIDFMGEMKPAEHTGGISKFVLWDQMRPAYAFERFGEGGVAVYDGLRRGQATMAFNTKKIAEFAEKAYTAAEVRAWEKDVKTIELEGSIIKMPVSNIMSFYELSKRPQALGHILGAGVRVATFTADGKKIADSGHKLTIEDVNIIIDQLTDRQKEVADNLQKFMQEQGGKWGNYVSIKRFGEKLFGEEHYFPINSDGRYLPANAEEKPGNASLYALLNMGFTKATTENASNQIILYSIFDVFSSHMASMAQYNAFALPVVDALKWFNYQQKSEPDENGKREVVASVRDLMDKTYGVPEETRPGSGKSGYAQNFVINIIKAFNGTEAQGTPYDSLGMQTLHQYNRAQVAYNLRVVMQQPMAITRAAQLIDYSSIIKGMKLNPDAIRKNIEEMQKHSGIAAWKALGFYDVNISRGLTSIIKHDETWQEKVIEFGMKGAEVADTLTWAGIWSACKEEVMRKQKLKPSDAGFFDAVTKLFEDVVYKTQVVDSVLTKNEFMRDKGFFARTVGSFMSEPTTTASMLIDSLDKLNMDMQRGMTRQQAWKKNKSMIVRTAYVYGVGAVLLAAVQAVADALRDDDEYQTGGEKLLEAFAGNLVDELVPFNKLPIVSDVYELAKELLSVFGVNTYGNPPQSVFMQWYDSLIKGTEIIYGKIKGTEDRYTWYGGAYKLLQAVSGIVGLPIAAATREIVTAWNNIVGAMAPSLKIKSYDAGDWNEIKYGYKDGYLTEEEATDLLVEKKLVRNENEAFFTLREWDFGEGYSRYHTIYDVVRNGGDFAAALKELTSHGYTEKEVLSQVKSKVGEWYKEKEITKQQATDMLSKNFGMDSKEVSSTVNRWSSKVVTGVDFEDIKDEFLAGNITASKAIDWYVRYGGYSRENATETVAEWNFEKRYGFAYSDRVDAFKKGLVSSDKLRKAMIEYGGLTEAAANNNIVAYEWMKKNPQYDLSVSTVLSYTKPIEDLGYSVEESGIKPDTFQNYTNLRKDCKGVDADEDGKADRNTVKNQVMDVIDDLPITNKQKDTLYFLNGWAKSTLHKAPWH